MYQPTFVEVSHNISVEVKPTYLEEESSPLAGKHVFAYFISIRNLGESPVTLLRRHWEIKDSNGTDHEVDGEGVIGQQPSIVPGGEHTYNSFCVLKSYRGSMEGYYTMQAEDGRILKVRIPKFLLISHRLN
ncbi:Co2+/Mg2+ efflux protein ApaG [Fodinibius salsisoli]|uniref:Co2+/Mg2+ efflux protein ApaG n=1 Tax=Fodinibius salsisoli TaxID=2820877 RepID=A0ABT3PIH7_9BACT|nr:Co2+/Mg2+ efflux protein ApaG [Fodinibius salsisoli]MCW9705741.1 Co2+/Mg2+ efflux protein ApaG [Fodinibius salsisoli]